MASSRSSKPMIGVRFPGTSLWRHDREARCLTATQVTSVRIRLSLQAPIVYGLGSETFTLQKRVQVPLGVRNKPPWSSGEDAGFSIQRTRVRTPLAVRGRGSGALSTPTGTDQPDSFASLVSSTDRTPGYEPDDGSSILSRDTWYPSIRRFQCEDHTFRSEPF